MNRKQSGGVFWIILLSLFLSALLVAAAGATYVYRVVHQPLSPSEEYFVIKPGQSFNSFARQLVSAGLTREAYSLRAWALWTGQATRIKAGQYTFAGADNLAAILDRVVQGKVILHQVQFIEGWTFRQLRDVLDQNDKLEHLTPGKSNAEVMGMLGVPEQHPEGMFFPDTYRFATGTSDLDILRQAYNAMNRVLEEEWQARFDDLPLDSAYDALILASVVEKETGKASERATISGVFINRLNKRMRLQTDPTVIYGLGDSFDGNIKRKHLKQDNPYNTYTRRGLPPTPIAMPGRDSIRAAVQPESTRSLYFVSRGDGSHKFSETLEEHNKAVRKYQLKRKSG